jgi:hypothetical protein
MNTPENPNNLPDEEEVRSALLGTGMPIDVVESYLTVMAEKDQIFHIDPAEAPADKFCRLESELLHYFEEFDEDIVIALDHVWVAIVLLAMSQLAFRHYGGERSDFLDLDFPDSRVLVLLAEAKQRGFNALEEL